MELSRPVVMQHQGYLTLTLTFQGQILKMLYLRNGTADWHGTTGMWVDRMLDPHCDFELWPHQWPWPLTFKVKFWKCRISWMGGLIDMERKGCESIGCQTHIVTLNCDRTNDLDFQGQILKICISRMWGQIDMARKGCESIGCYTHIVTLNCDLTHDLDLWFSRSNFEKVITHEWDARLPWKKRDVSR